MLNRNLQRVRIDTGCKDYLAAKAAINATTIPHPAHCCQPCCVPKAEPSLHLVHNYLLTLADENRTSECRVYATKGRKRYGACYKCICQYLNMSCSHNNVRAYIYVDKESTDDISSNIFQKVYDDAVRFVRDHMALQKPVDEEVQKAVRAPHSTSAATQHDNYSYHAACGRGVQPPATPVVTRVRAKDVHPLSTMGRRIRSA